VFFLLAEHTWDFKSNYAVIFLGGMGPGTRGFMQTRQSKLLLCKSLVLTVPLFVHSLFIHYQKTLLI